jgi:microcystin-dependent protein
MSEAYLGEIRLFAGNFAPRYWALCNGQIMSISQNTALFSILGTTYGGDGRTTFALPNLSGKAPMHWGDGQGLTPRVLGEMDGEAAVTLLQSQLPAHTHVPMGQSDSNSPSPEGSVWAKTIGRRGTPAYINADPNAQMGIQAIQVQGGNSAHNNRQPYLAINFIICLSGIFPSRP